MRVVSDPEDQHEYLTAMILSPSWDRFLRIVFLPEVQSLRKALLNNDGLTEKNQFAAVRQLRFLHTILKKTYATIGMDHIPHEYEQWFV